MARGSSTLAVVDSTESVADAGVPQPSGPSPAPPPHAATAGPGPRGRGAAPTSPGGGPDEAADPAARTTLTPTRPDARPAEVRPAAPGSRPEPSRPDGHRTATPAPRVGPDPRTRTLLRPTPHPRPTEAPPGQRPGPAEEPRTATVARPAPATRPDAGDEPPLVETGPPTTPHSAVTVAADRVAAGAAPPRPADRDVPSTAAVELAEAEEFLHRFTEENPAAGSLTARLAAVREEIAETGTYVHTTAELEYGARVAWRNSARCIGRLYWRSLHLRDRRSVVDPEGVADECVAHLRDATRRGRIRSTITVFAPDTPAGPGPRIWNEQLVRYAGYRAGGAVLGDPRYVGFTDTARSLGWVPPSPMGGFDVLPLVVSGGGEFAAEGPHLAEIPADAVLEVPLSHPDHEWFAELGLQWHAVPAISNMRLDVGGVSYPAAPFNGWYMATEIGARNLADPDRYDLLGEIAESMGLDTSSDRTMWRDRAAVELTLAVQHSFDTAGVTLADHHGESQRFLRHVDREEAAGRSCPVDWSWIVPPISGGLTPVFHRYYDPPTESGPMFRLDDTARARGMGCPV